MRLFLIDRVVSGSISHFDFSRSQEESNEPTGIFLNQLGGSTEEPLNLVAPIDVDVRNLVSLFLIDCPLYDAFP